MDLVLKLLTDHPQILTGQVLREQILTSQNLLVEEMQYVPLKPASQHSVDRYYWHYGCLYDASL